MSACWGESVVDRCWPVRGHGCSRRPSGAREAQSAARDVVSLAELRAQSSCCVVGRPVAANVAVGRARRCAPHRHRASRAGGRVARRASPRGATLSVRTLGGRVGRIGQRVFGEAELARDCARSALPRGGRRRPLRRDRHGGRLLPARRARGRAVHARDDRAHAGQRGRAAVGCAAHVDARHARSAAGWSAAMRRELLLFLLALAALPTRAHAFCRATTCDEKDPDDGVRARRALLSRDRATCSGGERPA